VSAYGGSVERMVAVLDRFALDANGKSDWFCCSNGDGTWTGALGGGTTAMSGEPTWEVEATGQLADVLVKLVTGCWAWCLNGSLEGPEFMRLLAGVEATP
jgi:hypothetical protein